MNFMVVGGSLLGAMLGLFVAKEFSDSWYVLLPCACLGAFVGIVLIFLLAKFPRRSD